MKRGGLPFWAVMRKWGLPLLAVILFAALAIVSLWSTDNGNNGGSVVAPTHGPAGHLPGYMIFIEPDLVKAVELTPKNGAAFTIYSKNNEFFIGDDFDPEEISITAHYATTLPYYRMLSDLAPEISLSDYGLDPPELTITINGEITFSIGGMTLDGGAYYMLMDGNIFIVDYEIAEQLLLPLNAYRIRRLWLGEPGDRPALTEISVVERYTIIRNDIDDEAPLGLSRYGLIYPFSFVCNDDAVREKVLSGINAIDLDEIADDVELIPSLCHTLILKAVDFEQTLYIGGVAPNGGRYLMLKGNDTVYIDNFGDYGFLDVTPLDLTYGLAFWLYRIDDVESITVTDNGQIRPLPEDISEINMRRFFVHVLNFSVAGMAEGYGDFNCRVTLNMVDGSVRELRFARQNERQLAVSIDGAEPIFACNIRDWQQIIEDLDALDAGRGIRE